MTQQRLVRLFSALATLLMISAMASAQDFQKSYSVSSGASINIRSVSGNITITGSSGSQVTVTGIKEGPDSNLDQSRI